MPKKETYEKIDPVFKEKWVAALRSGHYKQTSRTLRALTHDVLNEDKCYDKVPGIGYCCLGVACNLFGYRKGWRRGAGGASNHFGWRNLHSGTTKGFPFVSDKAAAKLAHLNDSYKSFSEIADWIEKNL